MSETSQTIDDVRRKLAVELAPITRELKAAEELAQTPTRRRYWRSMGELLRMPSFLQWAQHEFPQLDKELSLKENGHSRRRFLQLMGASMALAGLGAFLGHLWPVFFKFEGGKGVATALGVLLGFSGLLGLATLLTWVIIAAFFRYSSLASLVASVFAPVYYLMGGGVAWEFDQWICAAIAVMAALLIYRHRLNIQRLIEGKESKLGQKKQ